MNSKQKKRKAKILLLCIALLISITPYAQNSTIDSLRKILQTRQNDTGKVNTLNAISSQFRYENTDTSLYFANIALALAIKLSYKMGIADAKLRIARTCADQGKYNEGVKICDEALLLYKELFQFATASNKENILKQIGNTYNVTAHNRISQGNYLEGLKNSFLALKVREKTGDKLGIANTESNIGTIYADQQNYAEALKHLYIALKLYNELGNKANLSTAYSTIGQIFFRQANYTEALKNYLAGLKIAEAAGDKFNLAGIYINLASLNALQGNYGKALEYDFSALAIFTEIKNTELVAYTYNDI